VLVLGTVALAQVQRVRALAGDADRPRGLLADLAREVGSVHSVAARLSVGDGYRPCAARPGAEPGMPDMGCAAAPAWTPSPRVSRIARRAAEASREGADPDAAHTLAVIDLLAEPGSGKSIERAIQSLRAATRTPDHPAAAWADLSAAYLIRAEHEGAPRDLLSAVEAAERALEQAPRNRAALYDRALALQRFGLVDVAAGAWRKYLAVDRRSPWAAEARRRLAVTDEGPVSPAPPPAAHAPLADYAAYARTEPEAARLLGQDQLLGAWGAAVLAGDGAGAGATLGRAAALGEALRRRPGGDQTLWDEVRAIQSRGEATQLRALAAAHADYAAGRALYESADYTAAEPRLRGAAAAAGSPALAEWAELFLANIQVYLGEPGKGEDALLGLSLRVDTLRHPALAGRLGWAIAGTRIRTDRYEPALEPAEASARLFTRAGERENASTILSGLANAQFKLGDVDGGYATWHRALAALRPYRSSKRLHGLLVAIATATADDGLPRAAVRLQDESVEVTRRRGEPLYAAEARLARARLLPASGRGTRADIDSARAALRLAGPGAALGWVDADRQQAEGIASLFARPARPVRAALALDSAAAYFVGKGVPFRGFPAVVSAAEARLAMGDLPGATRRLETALAMLETRRDSIRVEPRRAAVFEDARGVVDRVVLLHLAGGRVARALDILDRGRASLAPAAPAPGRGWAVAGPPGEVGVEYALVADTLLAWRVSGRRVESFRTVVDTVRLARTVTRLLGLLEDGAGEAAVNPLLEQLHEWLLAPIRERLGPAGTALVLVVDGTLAQVPFAALRDRRGRYLMQDHPTRFAVSLRDAWRPRHARTAGGTAVVADPAFEPREHPGLSRLPGAAAEAAAIAREYGGARVLSGPAATGSAVREALQTAGVVHYAGHAVFDDERPERSYLVLAPAPERLGSGRLTAGSLGEMHLEQAPLVVLAACRTVNAGQGRAQGFSGLAGGLLAAGAGGVVGGLWEVDDASTRPLMLAFHHHYRALGDGARALRAAQLQLLASGDPALRSPSAWAGFRYAGQ
jgi:CHAT domain-containing protein/tetratricopeptide (TPR) repeat protein